LINCPTPPSGWSCKTTAIPGLAATKSALARVPRVSEDHTCSPQQCMDQNRSRTDHTGQSSEAAGLRAAARDSLQDLSIISLGRLSGAAPCCLKLRTPRLETPGMIEWAAFRGGRFAGTSPPALSQGTAQPVGSLGHKLPTAWSLCGSRFCPCSSVIPN
jgi:hypothetical protein